ncbi:septum formation protein Maf [Fulvivirga sp. RKSG066]|uniref:Maf family nucleotide pyrophosphatase n=1 Tax=Fulvivirga aurantia TaxID=2529383 RepID=UPI0012BC2D28|nr:Maf family protein [Fulvivirga aurantia]MTI21976.1 septum formation protein Maf [Fulvivirga aurantia]
MNLSFPLILASKSPRRQALLKEAGFQFEVVTKDVDESYPDDLEPLEVAKYIAEKKAQAFNEDINSKIVITADTVVLKGNTILGKPQSKEEAFNMLRSLSNTTHQVITGVSLFSSEKQTSFDDCTDVTFKTLSDEEIKYYIEKYEPYDKAGAYGIQEWIGMIGITEIKGSYFNVVGLPIEKLYRQLQTF